MVGFQVCAQLLIPITILPIAKKEVFLLGKAIKYCIFSHINNRLQERHSTSSSRKNMVNFFFILHDKLCYR